jgi:hypothetical protein
VNSVPPVSPPDRPSKPLLAVDVDGVISLFGFDGPPQDNPCKFRLIDGMAHCILLEAGDRLRRLMDHYELIWATGWEDRANDHLPLMLGLPQLPVLHFGRDARFGSAHWKIGPIDEYSKGRALAWIDDSLEPECYEWAAQRPDPTLLVRTDPTRGIEEGHVEAMIAWVTDGYTR